VVTVDVPADLVFDSYPGSLSQVFSNLIGNALLHGFDGRESGAIHQRGARAPTW
jgi:signal transduction histidine kinase